MWRRCCSTVTLHCSIRPIPHHVSVLFPVRHRRSDRRVADREAERADARRQEEARAEYFEPTTGAAVGKPAENQRGFLGFGSSARSMPLNPLLVLNKVQDPATKNILRAVDKLKRDPESVQLTEEQQQHVVNAFAETKWYAALWRPLRNVNYKRVRRWNYACQAMFVLCLIGSFVCMGALYRAEAMAFDQLTEEEKQAYFRIICGIRYSEVVQLSKKIIAEQDPMHVLPIHVTFQMTVREMMRLGWHEIDWEQESRTRYPKSALESGDFFHIFYWIILSFGKFLNGGQLYFSGNFGDLEMKRILRREEEAERRRAVVIEGPAERSNAASQ